MSVNFVKADYQPALDRLQDRRMLRALSYVDGHWTAGDNNRTFAVSDPATKQDFIWVAALDAVDTEKAITAAANALPLWRAMLPQQRSEILRHWHGLILAAKEDLALLMVLEQGKPLHEARDEIDYAASFVEWYAEEGKRLNSESVTSHLTDAHMMVSREALGVVGVVTPWNFPSAMLTRKAAAALAAGCTIVAHPSAQTPLSALALAELAERAGIPAGVFNVVTGDAATIVGRLCEDSRVRGMSFTGSTEIGKLIAAQCAPTMKHLIMELGGHAPLIIFDDADLEKAADIAIAAKFATSGQDCLAANRIYVQRKIAKDFNHIFAKKISALKLASGLDNADLGPLIHEKAITKVEEQVADAIAQGATCVTGGKRSTIGALFYEPTLLTDVPDHALMMREETFGPVAAVAVFDTEAEVVARANDSEYGLVAYLVTRDGARQLRVSGALEYGMVAVNRVKITGAPIPFGGWKQSGLGREGARYGIEAFSELKYLCIDTAA